MHISLRKLGLRKNEGYSGAAGPNVPILHSLTTCKSVRRLAFHVQYLNCHITKFMYTTVDCPLLFSRCSIHFIRFGLNLPHDGFPPLFPAAPMLIGRPAAGTQYITRIKLCTRSITGSCMKYIHTAHESPRH